MKFRYTILYVKNVEETLNFYEAVFGLSRKMLHDGGDYGELDTGTTLLAFASRELILRIGKSPSIADPKAPCFEIAFETDDVAAGITLAVKHGAKLVQEAIKMPWGQTVGYVSDSNGFLIEICTEIAA